MKKFIFIFMIIAGICVSCNSHSNAKVSSDVDSLAVDSTIIVNDSVPSIQVEDTVNLK